MNNDRDFNDGFYRSILLDCLQRSSHRNNTSMRDYILNEASYEDVLLAVTQRKPFLREGDAARSAKIQKAEEASSLFLDVLGFLAGGVITDGVATKYGLSGAQLAAKGFGYKTAKGLGMGTARIGASWIILPILLAWLAKKVIFGTMMKINRACNNKCSSKFKGSQARICVSRCKVVDYQKGMATIKSKLAQCNHPDVKNPEKCKVTIMKTLSHFRTLILREQAKLKKYNKRLQRK